MKLRLFPREEAYFDLLEAAATNMSAAAGVLVELVEDFTDTHERVKRLKELEHEGDRLTQAIIVRLNSTFVTPFDREDIYDLTNQLDDVTDAIYETGDMLVLHRVDEPIEVVKAQARLLQQAARATESAVGHLREVDTDGLRRCWQTIDDLEDEGDRLYRQARADLYEFSGEHPARFLLVWKDIIDQLEEAMDGLEDVSDTLESIVLKYA